MNWIIFVLIYYIIFSVLATIFILFDGINSVGLLPKEIYEGSKFNIVTCWILSILLFIDELNTLRKNISKKIKNFNLAELQKLESFIAEIEEK